MARSIPLEPGERIDVVVRRHWIALWPRLILILIAAGLPAGFAIGVLARAGPPQSIWRTAAALLVVWIGFWVARAAIVKRRYDRDMWVLTDRRLIALAAQGPFRSMDRFVELEDIQDVGVQRRGAAALLFGFGDLECSTRAPEPIVLEQVSRPDDVALSVQSAVRAARRAGASNEQRATSNED